MIDVTPYIEKLNWLQEWIEIQVDAEFLRRLIRTIWESCGTFISIHPSMEASLSFSEYCALKLKVNELTTPKELVNGLE